MCANEAEAASLPAGRRQVCGGGGGAAAWVYGVVPGSGGGAVRILAER